MLARDALEDPVSGPQHTTLRWLADDCSDSTTAGEDVSAECKENGSGTLGPFDNPSQFRLYDWHYNASLTKSKGDFDDLLDVLRSDGFSVDDLAGFSVQKAQDCLDNYEHPSGIFSEKDGWRESPIDLPLPKPRNDHGTEDAAPHFRVNGTYHRRLTDLIRSAAEDKRFSEQYHWIPYMYLWQPSPAAEDDMPNDPIRIFTDIYNSNAALREFESIQQRPRNPEDGADVEYVMAPLLIWSDATHLTSFGSASLWPIYLYFGSLSKYIRGMPTEFAAHHLAYIPSLPDDLQDYYLHVYGTPISADVLTFCKRELMQRIWLLLLDDEFLDAYENGILVLCGDGVTRRIFPRILTYSADYPEKILLTALKPLSKFPCPRCLVPKDSLCLAGTPQDLHNRRYHKRQDTPQLRSRIARARKLVFRGASLNSKRVQALLESEGLNPIQVGSSAFSSRLSRFGMNHYQLFVPDLMHEFEIGVWKNTFAHLLRLLAAQGLKTIHEFNRRMRLLPTFGRDTIRKFWHDVAARKQLAARDYEDFLICMMPVFEGLLPLEDDQTIADLLFELANWHALAKLRLHTSITLDIFRAATQHMCEAMRRFAHTTCQQHETRELPKETEARVRREEKKGTSATVNRTPKVVRFNVLNTFKYHSLPDYPDYIEESGTTDNGNTQVCELEHRHVKRFYVRTNKIRHALQIAKHQRRAALLRALRDVDSGYVPRRVRLQKRRSAARQERDGVLAPTPPVVRYAISQSQRAPLRLRSWLTKHKEDAAVKNFIPLLRAHLFGRLTNRTDYDEFTAQDLDHVHIDQERIYQHKSLQLNYTTYDMRRNQDVINPRTHADIMVLADNSVEAGTDRYWYARVLDIYHAFVRYSGPDATRTSREWQRVDFLWVRWYESDPGYPCGFQERRLPRLRFPDTNDPDLCPFGFVDPREVIRGAYIMPAFAHGMTSDLLGPSRLARRDAADSDYEYYYVGIFADRDIYMRHLGGGVGHQGIGMTVSESRQHALRLQRAQAPEDAEDLVTVPDGEDLDAEAVADLDADKVDAPDDDEEQDISDQEGEPVDDDWHYDAGLGGLVGEELGYNHELEVVEDGSGYEEEEEPGYPMDPYSVEGFAPL
ncbi:hypothetical protein PYCCODRAFT_1416437 [Trametes coccinea BRFM310]|uniref:Uncharacterized protein n=1 Tax=Trametes coccinea (strain BRFM310) TaxID=1353009 RepID=A0A1Y2IDK0_TRAC3|nr:hypothetical protein PYCCODRAFT_1416437 [Trametes coccinea BRFM310]